MTLSSTAAADGGAGALRVGACRPGCAAAPDLPGAAALCVAPGARGRSRGDVGVFPRRSESPFLRLERSPQKAWRLYQRASLYPLLA